MIEIINKPLLFHLVGYLYYWQMGFNSVFKGLKGIFPEGERRPVHRVGTLTKFLCRLSRNPLDLNSFVQALLHLYI